MSEPISVNAAWCLLCIAREAHFNAGAITRGKEYHARNEAARAFRDALVNAGDDVEQWGSPTNDWTYTTIKGRVFKRDEAIPRD